MKAVDEGILIHRAPYSETSLLVTVLCKSHGLTTFLFQGGRKKQGNILFPMAHIEFSYYKRTDSSLPKMTQVNLADVARTIPFHPVKSGLAFFMAEMIRLVIRSGHQENQLFQRMLQETLWLDASEELTNYPLLFLAVLCQECGISPVIEHEHPTVFDLQGGKLTTVRPNHVHYLEGSWVHWFETLLTEDRIAFLSHAIPKSERLQCFDAWIRYFQHHLHGMRDLKSVEVVQAALS